MTHQIQFSGSSNQENPSGMPFRRKRRYVLLRKRRKFARRSMRNARSLVPFRSARISSPPALRGWFPQALAHAVEKKFINWTIGHVDITTTGTMLSLVQPAQGTTAQQRLGNKIVVKSLYLRMMYGHTDAFVGSGAAAANPGTIIRTMILIDKQPNGALPGLGDILDTSGGGAPALIPLNLAYRDRFIVLMDKNFHLGPYITTGAPFAGMNGVAPATGIYKKYKKLSVPVHFKGNAGSIADVASNSFILLNISATGSAPAPAVYAELRLRFVDA